MTRDDDRSQPALSRRYPARPIVAVGAVVVTADGLVVLVRRRREPLAGRWTLPGGALEVGEMLRAGVAREVREETELVVDVGPIVDVVDHVVIDDSGRTEYHCVITDYLCRSKPGTAAAGTDVDAVALADPAVLDAYQLTAETHAVIRRGWELYTAGGRNL